MILSDSEDEIIHNKRKSTKIFNDDSEEDESIQSGQSQIYTSFSEENPGTPDKQSQSQLSSYVSFNNLSSPSQNQAHYQPVNDSSDNNSCSLSILRTNSFCDGNRNSKSDSEDEVDSDFDTLQNTRLENTLENSCSDSGREVKVPQNKTKFSLITESDLESENDEPVRKSVDSGHESEDSGQLSSKSKVKSKKKKNSVKSISKNNTELNSGSESEAESFPKRSRKSGNKKSESTKISKKDKDPLLTIRSETQRRIRQGRISLPYHQPKQRSLHEFLERRKTTLSIPLKATPDLLKNVCQQLTKKEKEVEEFYKSDSESSDREIPKETISETPSTQDLPQSQPYDEMENINKELNGLDRELSECDVTNPKTMELCIQNDNVCSKPNSCIELSENISNEDVSKILDVETPPDQTDKMEEALNEIEKESSSCDAVCEENPISGNVCENNPVINESVPCLVETTPDSADFELKLNDSCSQSAEKEDSSMESGNSRNVMETSETNKNNFMKKKLDLLSKLQIKLPDLKSPEVSEDIEFEIQGISSLRKKNIEGVSELKEKFVKHSLVKISNKPAISHVNIISTQKDSEGELTGIVKETLILNPENPESEFSHPKFSIPGAKHAYFKKKMLTTLISKKEANWKEYQSEKRRIHGSDSEEEIDFEDEEPCKKLNFEPYHPEEEPDDDELIEDDVVFEEKEHRKNKYIDEEAEESDNEENENLYESLGEDEQDDEETNNSIFSEERNNTVEKDKNVERQTDESGLNLFKYNITGSDLENKLLGLESISQKGDIPDEMSASQIFGLCSGKFTSQNVSKPDSLSTEFYVDSQNTDSQNICLTLPDCEETPSDTLESNNNVSNDSDNEEIFARKKKVMKLQDSDDESNHPNEVEPDEGSENSEPELDDDEETIRNEEYEDYGNDVGYNSEEEMITYKEKTREFFEDEAELSESEWGSEDENEKDLDKLEKEEGDDDDIDTEKLKEELGKIHMRQLLDDDQHDVRVLKEMLLEDGELHSDEKRQRKFQWKNMNGDVFFSKSYNDSDDEMKSDGDDENEEHWRKLRHERETFLSQQESKLQTESDNVDGAFIQLIGNTKVISESVISKHVEKSPAKSMTSKISVNSQFKCGSFLSRGKLLLNKLTLSIGECKDNVNGAKNSKNFVFGLRSPEKNSETVTVEKNEKRKFVDTTKRFSKRIKLSIENDKLRAQDGLLARLASAE